MVTYHGVDIFRHQPDAVLTQANPNTGVKYTVLDTIRDVRIISAIANVEWTVQPTPLELHFTIDGQAVAHIKDAPVTATDYFVDTQGGMVLAGNQHGMQAFTANRDTPFVFEGRSIKIEAETTGGTTQSLDARVKYALRR